MRHQSAQSNTHAKPVSTLPAEGYVRLKQIIGDSRASPPIPGVIPVCKASWYAGIKEGRYPAPVKIGKASRASFWPVESIRALLASAE